jgi:hypothetical protein
MSVLTNPLYMIAAFVAFVFAVVIYEVGSLMGARQATKQWAAVTGISLAELASGQFKEELARLRQSIESSRVRK